MHSHSERCFILKISIILWLVFTAGNVLAQSSNDSISIRQVKKELKLLKALREKDSLKMALLTQELKRVMLAGDSASENPGTNSLLLKQKEEIENLRKGINGVSVVFLTDTLFKIYTSSGPYNAQARANNLEQKLQLL